MKFKITDDMVNFDLSYKSERFGETKLNIELSDFVYEDDDNLYKRLWENDLKVTGNANVKIGSIISVFSKNEFYYFSFDFTDELVIISNDKVIINKQLKDELKNPKLVIVKSYKSELDSEQDRDLMFDDIKECLAENIDMIINEIHNKMQNLIKIGVKE